MDEIHGYDCPRVTMATSDARCTCVFAEPAPTPQPKRPSVEDINRPDDLRDRGWAVAVHNDYRLNGESFTFWLLTKDGRAVKGEGRTDGEALDRIRVQLLAPTPRRQKEPTMSKTCCHCGQEFVVRLDCPGRTSAFGALPCETHGAFPTPQPKRPSVEEIAEGIVFPSGERPYGGSPHQTDLLVRAIARALHTERSGG